MIVNSVLDVAADPLFMRLHSVTQRAAVHLKIEGLNAAGSIKLKTARQIVLDLENAGRLRAGSRLIESSSGNLGVALAVISAERGYHFTCVSDPNIAPPTSRLMSALGATVIIVKERDPQGGYLKTRLDLIRQMVAKDPALVWTNQYANRSNARAHYLTTGPEILQSFPQPDWVFIGAGTTGTLGGCGRYLREKSPRTRVIAVDSVGSVTFGAKSGARHLPGIGTGVRPEIADECVMERVVWIAETDAVKMCRRLARKQGLAVGCSTGSVLAAVMLLEEELAPSDTIVAISPDLGDHYLETLYDDEWVSGRFPALTQDAAAVTAVEEEDYAPAALVAQAR